MGNCQLIKSVGYSEVGVLGHGGPGENTRLLRKAGRACVSTSTSRVGGSQRVVAIVNFVYLHILSTPHCPKAPIFLIWASGRGY